MKTERFSHEIFTLFLILLETFSACLRIPFAARSIVGDTIRCSKFLSVPSTIFLFLWLSVFADSLLRADGVAKQGYSRTGSALNREMHRIRCMS